ncbi:MAG: NAD(P)H-hydrate dehydratase [Planctomycetes bacterium]|nr:NAD(P)H-hydrate dehydratase [Planctomycetota bacterium]
MTGLARVPSPGPLPPLRGDSHKGDYGRVLVVAGSPGMTGAAYLAAKAALRSGAGVVVLAVPRSVHAILEVKTTCVITAPLPETRRGTLSPAASGAVRDLASRCDAVALGPGVSRDPQTVRLVLELVEALEVPLVLDADGIHGLATRPETLGRRRGPTVLTPHPGEYRALTGREVGRGFEEREEAAARLGAEGRCVVVLKGGRAVVSDGQAIFRGATGNPGMSTAGSGDVLTGLVASLVGQGMAPFEAACLGVHLHGLAGDIAAKVIGPRGVIATDILQAVPSALKLHDERGTP